ncbi:MAG: M1 family metallopeptidase [Chlorobi bacterium]|nr:M1 family metallopeptidase [Chlorobiota bacterium]
MKKLIQIVLTGVTVLLSVVAFSQINNLVPLNVKKAYQNETRSLSGAPGPAYWQNHTKYEIETELLVDSSNLKGRENVVYFNESPDTLKKIVMRLYPDIYKKGNARSWPINPNAVGEGMVIEQLKVNGQDIDLSNKKAAARSATNLYIFLTQPLLPGDSLEIFAKWHFHVSEDSPVRMGNYGHNRFFIAYWYPQIAVYDDIDGWDQIEYQGTVEFYNDFNDYDINVTVPANYVVWATGTLKNEKELFNHQVLKRLKKAREGDEVIKIFTSDESRNNKVLKSKNEKNIWHFTASRIPDFTFATAPHFNWDASSLVVDSATGRRVFVDAIYPDSTRSFDKAAEASRESIKYFSFQMPCWPFPYPHITAFCNGRRGGGMESPMMTNDGDPSSNTWLYGLLAHENAHTYFPFYMGTNERKYAWMDEGWAVYLISDFLKEKSKGSSYAERGVYSFEQMNGQEQEPTLMTLSYLISGYSSYRYQAYTRPGLAYAYLKDALGDSIFLKALDTYIQRWHGKHPIPYDFFNTFSFVAGKSLYWYFKPWFFEKARADLGIRKVTAGNEIIIENYGGLPLPVVVTCEFEDGTKETYKESVSVWSSQNPAVIVQANPDKIIKKVVLGDKQIPDINKENNQMEIN